MRTGQAVRLDIFGVNCPMCGGVSTVAHPDTGSLTWDENTSQATAMCVDCQITVKVPRKLRYPPALFGLHGSV